MHVGGATARCVARGGLGYSPATEMVASELTSQLLPPGPQMPSALQTVGWVMRPLPFLERCRDRYGDMFTLRIHNEPPWVFLGDPEHIKEVFTGDPGVLRAGEANAILRPVLGSRSVLLLDEPDHMAHRKLMLPPFHGERMQAYGDLMGEVTRRNVARWPVGEPFPLWPRMQEITFEVIMRAVFGMAEGAALEHVRRALLRMLEWTTDPRRLGLLALLGPRGVMRNSGFRAVMEAVDQAVLGEIASRRRDPRLQEREDILSMLLLARYEDGSQMSDRELRDELLTLLLAGHETTATSLAWAFERLLHHPEKLARLREELRVGEDAYLEAVIRETLRLRPVIAIVMRKLTEPVEISVLALPSNNTVVPCIHLVHRRPDVYPEPRSFRPERFLEQPPGTYTWLPFGGGVRRCLGASFAIFEMGKVLATVLSEVDLRAAEPRSERVVRRMITFAPEQRALSVVTARKGAPSTPQTARAAGAEVPV